MALRDIVMDTEPMLRKKSRTVDKFDAKLHKLLDDMLETMEHNDGAGLAAPQVGILRRAAIIRTEEDEIIEFVNPVIIESKGRQVCSEGCLSVSNRRANVVRPKHIKLKALDRYGKEFMKEYSDFDADVSCHEIDHLNGILFYDRECVSDDELKSENEE